MPPAVVILNAGAFIRPSKFKLQLKEIDIQYTDIVFGASSEKFVQIFFETPEQAADALLRLKEIRNFRGEPFKMRAYEDFELFEVRKSCKAQETSEDSSNADITQINAYFAAPFNDPDYSKEEELLYKEKLVRNQIKHQFMRILKGQTLASAAAANTPALQKLKKTPDYMNDPMIKQVVMVMPSIQDVDLKRNYRTKSEFLIENGKVGAFCRGNDGLQCFSALETAECGLHPKIVTEICAAIELIVGDATEGFALFRCAGNAVGQEFNVTQVLLRVSSDDLLPNQHAALLKLPDLFPVIKGLHINNETFGDEFIVEQICGVNFRITADSFFQSNVQAAERMFEYVASIVPSTATRILDGCCGSGVVGLSVRAYFLKIYSRDIEILGIDICAESIQAARVSAADQGARCTYIAGSLEGNLESIVGCDCVVFDPPRAGLHPSVVRWARASQLDSIIYISCSPKSLGRDLFLLCAESGSQKGRTAPFHVSSLRAFNSFPGCAHVETAVFLERFSSDFE